MSGTKFLLLLITQMPINKYWKPCDIQKFKTTIYSFFGSTVAPRYKEVGYNKTLLKQGNFAGPYSS